MWAVSWRLVSISSRDLSLYPEHTHYSWSQTLARRAAQLPELLPELRSALPSLLSAPNPAVHASLLALLSQLLPHETDAVAGAATVGSASLCPVRMTACVDRGPCYSHCILRCSLHWFGPLNLSPHRPILHQVLAARLGGSDSMAERCSAFGQYLLNIQLT